MEERRETVAVERSGDNHSETLNHDVKISDSFQVMADATNPWLAPMEGYGILIVVVPLKGRCEKRTTTTSWAGRGRHDIDIQ